MELFVGNGDEDEPPAGREMALWWAFLLAFFTFHFHPQDSFLHHLQLFTTSLSHSGKRKVCFKGGLKPSGL